MNKKQVELCSPWLLLLATVASWQILCSAFEISEFIVPRPWRTYWVTMAGFGLAIVVGVYLGFVVGSSRRAYAAVYPQMTAFNALAKAAFVPILVVWFGIGAGPAILTAFLISLFPITLAFAGLVVGAMVMVMVMVMYELFSAIENTPPVGRTAAPKNT